MGARQLQTDRSVKAERADRALLLGRPAARASGLVHREGSRWFRALMTRRGRYARYDIVVFDF